MPTDQDMFPRACGVVVLVSSFAALAVGAPAASAKLFVSTSVAADGTGHVEGYAVDMTATPPVAIAHDLTLDVERGGASVGTVTSSTGYVSLPSLAVAAGDVVTLTDADAPETETFTYSGAPSLALTGLCGGKFAGTRDEGATVGVSAASTGGGSLGPATVASGAGTSFSGGVTSPLTSAWTLKASETRIINTNFTVFSDASGAVADCPPAPVVAPAPAPVATPVPAPAVTPVPSAVVPPRDLVAPTGTLKLRVVGAYRALVGGTFKDAVTITEAGTVAQTLYAGNAVVGTGRAKVGRAGAATVKVRLTRSGRSHLKTHKATALRLVTTVTDVAGNARVLTPKRFTITRGH